MSSLCPPPSAVTTLPVRPCSGSAGWEWSSWPSAGWITTLASSICVSSTSVTDTFQLMVSPKSKNAPVGGSSKRTSGRVLPTVIGTVVVPVLPCGSVTVSRAL